VTTTLGRDGSDYTASLIAAGIKAELVEIWTDVDGVMSADPRIVAESFAVPSLTYEEAMELSYFGAKVIHPYTMIPAVKAGIPIRIRSTLNPEAPGTLVAAEISRHPTPITGMASIPGIALMNVQGGGMIGVTGMAGRIFGALARTRVNIIMISQASSEHSICLAFRESEAAAVRETLREELALELQNGIIQDFEILRDLVIVAVIGENMRGTPGISGRLFSALGGEKINVLAIAQGSSERNISFVIHSRDTGKALSCIHGAFLSKQEQEP
jgi:aspartokinase/homoserine dehydrogenase 1